MAGELAAAEPAQLTPADYELSWRAHVVRLLQERVDPTAAAVLLPEYRELPANAQESFRANWRRLPANERRERLGRLDPELGAAAGAQDSDKLAPGAWEIIWRAHLYAILEDVKGPETAQAFWRDRSHRPELEGWGEGTLYPELADRGLLSLVVRTPTVLVQRVLGALAHGASWSWRAGNPKYPDFYYYLTGLLVVAVALVIIRVLAMFCMNYAAALATMEASTRLRRAVYHHTFRLGTLAFRALGPGEAVGIFTQQIVAVENGLYTGLTVVAREPVKFVLLLAFALFLNPWLSLTFILFAILVWVIGGQVATYFRRQERAAIHRAAEQLALLQESLMLMRLVKSYMMELFNQSRVERQLSVYAGAQLRHYRGQAIYRPVLIFLGTLAAVVLLYVAGLIVLSGRLGVARAITLVTAIVSLYWPLLNWLEHRADLRRARKAAAILFNFLDRPGEVGQVVGAEFLPPLSQELRFDNVSLQEPGTGRKLLSDVSFSIQAGQRVALVGPEDIEKHALVYLIPRFLDPNSGEITIDHHNVRWVTFDSLRAQIALVLQHNLLFNDTVANNIGCGDAGYDLPKIIEAAKIAHAHHFIQKLPAGYETRIGEMGHALNMGEQFRIALARAILRDPALFIVEEPAIVLDADTKAMVDDTFTRVLPGRTVIFLPHRVSTIRSCDQVLLLHKGKIESAGDHRELLAQSDLYRHLQYMEFNAFADQV
jgi:ATP-binding cassette subfamily B protein